MKLNLNLLGKALLITVFLISCKKTTDPAPAAPTADFSYEIGSYGFVSFTNKSVNGTSYAWDFGDGTGATDQSTNHNFLSYGSFPVQLTVTGPGGTVNKKLIVAVPNPLIGTWGLTDYSRTNCNTSSNNTSVTCSSPCSILTFTATAVNTGSGPGPYSLSGNKLKFLAADYNPVITINIVGNTLTFTSQSDAIQDLCKNTSHYTKI